MTKTKFRYNPQTLTFDTINVSLRQRLAKFALRLLIAGGIFVGLGFAFTSFIDTPSVLALQRENADLLLKYKLTQRQMNEMVEMMQQIETHDNQLYRVIFESDPIPLSIRKAATVATKSTTSAHRNTPICCGTPPKRSTNSPGVPTSNRDRSTT